MLGLESVITSDSSRILSSNSGVKALVSGVCSRLFMVHPRIWHCPGLHTSLRRPSFMPYLLASPQELGKMSPRTSRSMHILLILYLGSYSLQSHRSRLPFILSRQNHL